MALKMINFILMFSLINLSLCGLDGLETLPLDQSTVTVPNMVYCPSSYHSMCLPHSFKPFFPGTDFLNTFLSSNTSCKDGKCETHHYIVDGYGSEIILIFGTFLITSIIGFILHLIWVKQHDQYDPLKGKRDNFEGTHKQKNETNLLAVRNHVKIFSFEELKIATLGFYEGSLITKGDNKTVYKGSLFDGRKVAIKRSTKRGYKHELSFQMELSVLTEARHDNLTSLIGYCTEDNERMLVFEYMGNGTLHDQLYSAKFQSGSPFHSWKLLIKILLDCARAIECLHMHASRGVMHRHITISNILLDENWNARITDLGLALVGPEPGYHRVNVDHVVGTNGYIDPDYNLSIHSVILKCDVYIFGVVMTEMLTTNGAYDQEEGTMYADFIAPKIITGELSLYLDRRASYPIGIDARAVRLIGELSEGCIRRSSVLRPTMSEVVQEIENVLSLYDQPAPESFICLI